MRIDRPDVLRWTVTRTETFDAVLVGGLVFLSVLLGIYIGPTDTLAAFWPTNAVLVGLMVRRSTRATSFHWLASAGGYLAANLCAGYSAFNSALLTGANMAGVAVCVIHLRHLPEGHLRLRHPRAMLSFLVVVVAGSGASAACGAFVHPSIFGGTSLYGFSFWFTTELVNYIAMLPVMITMPEWVGRPSRKKRLSDRPDIRLQLGMPMTAVAGVLWLETQMGGPSVVPYPVPALLWCALTYSIFTTACITLAFSMWTLITVSTGALTLGPHFEPVEAMMALRLAVTLTALAPLTVASVMVARNDLLAKLRHAASHDQMTGLLNRAGFYAHAEALLATTQIVRGPLAVFMMDIDFFKKVNDTYGHAAGDDVIRSFARVVEGSLRDGDLIGRMGGEEFAVLLTACGEADASAIAQGICEAFAEQPVVVGCGAVLHCSVSVGIASAKRPTSSLDALLSSADAALYQAKEAGRNRVVMSGDFRTVASQNPPD